MYITFLPLSYKTEAEPGSNLLYIAREQGIDLGGVCAGAKTCGKCKVLITKGNDWCYEKEEMLHLSEEERAKGYRLACSFTIKEDTCVILTDKKVNKGISQDKLTYKNHALRVSKSQNEDSKAVRKTYNYKTSYGIAVDVGTTTVVARLWELNEKRCLGTLTRLNPQRLYGGDVISRITYASQSSENLQNLTKLIRECCNELIQELVHVNSLSKTNIDKVVLVANTTMTHLLLGKPVDNLIKIPFQGVSYDGVMASPRDLKIDINPDGFVYVMPGISGHVGGDTVGCILSENLFERKGTTLLIDIGTNGELVFAKDGRMTVCSTAAGPAFEGGALHQGMGALVGAITKVQIREDKTHLEYIGKEEGAVPVGICGSGIIEAIAELYRMGLMDETGRLQGLAGESNEFILWEDERNKVVITQKDIREIQLAKAAIYAAMRLLLKNENTELKEIDYLLIAGAFGSNLDVCKAITIGLLPGVDEKKVQLIGNAALSGAEKVLLNDGVREIAEENSSLVKHLELAVMELFQEEFIKAMSFPRL
ncbi:hypothetical protein acsn021_10670 [Anaerocolumna cellulosilytica]|uniref:Uncharacterized protein n=1 Tax=Anaerocolumna cellulosilytica TaxID=433286 RepID=A0A6S6R378_9FIRM|nr:ASKHA domain-containing protein [Anaerocolumna cellulosilytica]MBB5194554.1 uncharacterized 2Fe-2S/4Fe-4S cluster protein (DUF4445 family) [Anaerocolumna cellulosilytica]BCJ93498.1 hypothetical protein acsn021_10670 [Anaerocolumna cellulosilytica]